MKYFLVILLSIPLFCFAQNEEEIDSLKRLIDSAPHDTLLAKAYLKLSGYIYTKDFEASYKHSKTARSIAEEGLKSASNPRVKHSLKESLSNALHQIGYYFDSKG